MGDELVILHRVAAALESAGIAYMVTGSVALSVSAEPRMTKDVDLVVELSNSDGEHPVSTGRVRETPTSVAQCAGDAAGP